MCVNPMWDGDGARLSSAVPRGSGTLCPCPSCPPAPTPRRLQRGDGGIQEHLLHRLGRGRPGQNPTPLEALLPKHAGSHLRGGQQRPRASAGVCRGAAEDAAGGRAAGCRLAGVCQQAGHAQRHGGERADRQAGAADAAQQDLVRAGNVCDPGHGALRRAGLAIARALQALAGPAAQGPNEPGTSLPTAVLFGFLCFIWGGGAGWFCPFSPEWPRLCVFIWWDLNLKDSWGSSTQWCPAFAPAALRAGRPPHLHVLSARACPDLPGWHVPERPRSSPRAGGGG